MKKWVMIFTAILMVFTLAACSSGNNGGNAGTENESPSNAPSKPAAEESKAPEQVTLKFFTALADRSNGMGKIEQSIIDAYMQENPNVKIEVEALQDEPYKAKAKVYASTESLPDIIQSWGQPSFIKPLIDNGLLLELNPADFESSGFIPGSTDGFSQGGKLYGLPRNTDFLVLYYNKKLFDDNGIAVPATVSELTEVSKQFREKGINPITTNAMEGWSLPIWFEYAAQRASGDFGKIDAVMNGESAFSGDADFQAAAQSILDLAEADAFADGFLTADYGTSRNLFGQGQAAMFVMGNWEAGLATDENFPEEFRNNVGAIPYPSSDKGKASDLAAWFGGGYSISKNTKHPEEAVKFMQYFFKPENWAKQLWQTGSGTPAQKFDQFLTGEESALQKGLVDIFNSTTSASNTPFLDLGTEEFKTKVMEAHQKLFGNSITPEEFLKELDAAVALLP
ncbi:extracellular solute-binding protein [Paenibacillus nanensis]|uniref:Extracellular solute-binding protein n=1 Tax=Paenibacillus nanensis TaxID=393251 RepID=A0A3A1VLQ1_9BACL|nr:extracellular solute-binding protein [Paenibacillus nanensis]RIX60566.1 extracellular solute-binding protein [Paenibacillus nanensis]